MRTYRIKMPTAPYNKVVSISRHTPQQNTIYIQYIHSEMDNIPFTLTAQDISRTTYIHFPYTLQHTVATYPIVPIRATRVRNRCRGNNRNNNPQHTHHHGDNVRNEQFPSSKIQFSTDCKGTCFGQSRAAMLGTFSIIYNNTCTQILVPSSIVHHDGKEKRGIITGTCFRPLGPLNIRQIPEEANEERNHRHQPLHRKYHKLHILKRCGVQRGNVWQT